MCRPTPTRAGKINSKTVSSPTSDESLAATYPLCLPPHFWRHICHRARRRLWQNLPSPELWRFVAIAITATAAVDDDFMLYISIIYFFFPCPWHKHKQVETVRGLLNADILANDQPFCQVGTKYCSPPTVTPCPCCFFCPSCISSSGTISIYLFSDPLIPALQLNRPFPIMVVVRNKDKEVGGL